MGFVRVKLLSPVVTRDPVDNRVRREISMYQMKLVNAIRTANQYVGPALHAISFSLTSGGIRVTKRRHNARTGKRGSEVEELTPDMKALMLHEWLPFCEHVLEDIITFGFAVISLDVTRKVPIVRNPIDAFQRISVSSDKHGLDRVYELTVREDNPGPAAHFLTSSSSSGGGPADPNDPERGAPPMFVLECWPPGADGDLTSLCRSLIPLDAFMQTIMQCQITVALRNAQPVLVTSTEKQPVDQKNAARDISAAGDSALLHRDQSLIAHRVHFEARLQDAENLRQLNERFAQGHNDINARRVSQLNGANSWMHTMNTGTFGNHSGTNTNITINPVTGTAQFPAMLGAKQFEGSLIPLPPNTVLEKPPEAHGADSFIAKMWEIFRDITLMNLGVPPTLWGSTSSSVAGNLVVVNTYNDTKHHYRVILQDVVQFCFIALFGDSEIKAEAHRTLQRRTKLQLANRLKGPRVDDTPESQARARATAKAMETAEAAGASSARGARGTEDDDADADDHEEIHIEVAFPGVLDMEQIAALNELGMLTHEGKRRYISTYLGIPEDDLADEPMDPLTGRPMKEVQEEQYEREDTVMKTQAELQMSVKGPPKSGVGKRPAQKKPRTVGKGN